MGSLLSPPVADEGEGSQGEGQRFCPRLRVFRDVAGYSGVSGVSV